MKRRSVCIILLAAVIFVGIETVSSAYFLNTSETAGKNDWVLQLGYASKDFGSQINSTKGSPEIKLAYGLNRIWNVMAYLLPGIIGEPKGSNFYSVGGLLEFSILKTVPHRKNGNPPVDLSVIGGLEHTGFSNGTSELNCGVGFILGKNYPVGITILTPFLGTKIAYFFPSQNAQSGNDFELSTGLRLGISPSLALHLEGGFHWLSRGGNNTNSSGLSAGIAWNF